MKTFQDELFFFLEKIEKNEPFSLSRFGDGELAIIRDESIDLSEKFNGEHKYVKGEKKYQPARERLIESLTWECDGYYVGIPCRCCVGDKKHDDLRKQYFNNEKHLTWANIFVNANYHNFRKYFLKAISGKDIYFIGNKNAKIENINIEIKKHFKVGKNSWINDLDIIEDVKKDANNNKNVVFLFAAGVLSNIAVRELHEYNNKNFYIDIGSTLDVDLDLGETRLYLKGGQTLNKICVW